MINGQFKRIEIQRTINLCSLKALRQAQCDSSNTNRLTIALQAEPVEAFFNKLIQNFNQFSSQISS